MLTLDKVYHAAYTLKDVARITDMMSANIVDELRDKLFLKTENLQRTGSFKVRGAYYKISKLTKEEQDKGIVACSAGNHAQGVALAASRNNIKSLVYMPDSAPISKVEATKALGADVVLQGESYDDAYEAALEYVEKTGASFVHPFNDEDVITGQATIALEILQQLPDVENVIVPVGGGGLISGISYVIKQLRPNCKVYGVQASNVASMKKSIEENKIVKLDKSVTFADGIAVKRPGEITFDVVSKYVDKIVSVSEDEIATAVLTLMEKQKIVCEGAGAVSVAAVLFDKLPIKNQKTCCVLSGGNIDVNILNRVINRGLLSTGRLADLIISLTDKPGQLSGVSEIIARNGGNVLGVFHDQGKVDSDINSCTLQIKMETRNFEQIAMIKKDLIENGFDIVNQ